jgi:DNA-binding MarR family transcriptional regulator
MAGRLQAEIKQSKPFTSLREEALLNLWRTTDALNHAPQQLLRTHGVSQTQYNALRILRGAGKDGLPAGEIGARMVTRDPDITRLLDRLERDGLARRGADKSDRRIVRARITPKGLNLLARLDHPLMQLIEQTLGHMKDARLKALIGLLEEARGQ